MEAKDLLELKALMGGNSMSPYEQFKTQHIQAKGHTSGVAVTGLVTGIVGTVAGLTAWIFAPVYANAKNKEAKEAAYSAKELANVQIAASQRQIDQLTNLFAAERQERIAGDLNITTTINDSVQGSQSGTLTAQQQAELSAIQNVTNTVTAGLMTGQYSQNPLKVVRVSGQRECGCDGGCNI